MIITVYSLHKNVYLSTEKPITGSPILLRAVTPNLTVLTTQTNFTLLYSLWSVRSVRIFFNYSCIAKIHIRSLVTAIIKKIDLFVCFCSFRFVSGNK